MLKFPETLGMEAEDAWEKVKRLLLAKSNCSQYRSKCNHKPKDAARKKFESSHFFGEFFRGSSSAACCSLPRYVVFCRASLNPFAAVLVTN